MLFSNDRSARLVMVIQAIIKMAVLLILSIVLHNQPIGANARMFIYSILGFSIGWEGAVIFYRLVTVLRG
jgi:hypothetical protein